MDGISAIGLNNAAAELCPILTRIFEISYNSEIFPDT